MCVENAFGFLLVECNFALLRIFRVEIVCGIFRVEKSILTFKFLRVNIVACRKYTSFSEFMGLLPRDINPIFIRRDFVYFQNYSESGTIS